MEMQTITRDQVIALAQTMPLEKLVQWYEYGLFVQARPLLIVPSTSSGMRQLREEMTMWDAASDQDWLSFEQRLEEETYSADVIAANNR